MTLIAGPVSCKISDVNTGITIHHVESCQQMYDAATKAYPQMDAAILCAAVADFRPAEIAEQKIKRVGESLDIHLVANPDIAAALGQMKRASQVLVGFALETDHEQQHAEQKRAKKHLDFIVLNSLRNEGTCFRSDENRIAIISADSRKDYAQKSKQLVAKDIIDELTILLIHKL